MTKLAAFIHSVGASLKRARMPILTVVLFYAVAVIAGILMVNLGSQFALQTRDQIVGRAYSGSDPTINAFQSGSRFQASFSDFSRNLVFGAVPDTVGGLGVVFPYFVTAYRGWVGGIVSVDQNHTSRLAQPSEAAYYLVTLILQLIPYSLAGGAGVQLGLSYYRSYGKPQIPKWLGIPKLAVIDVARIYILVIPLFLIASLWEFFLA